MYARHIIFGLLLAAPAAIPDATPMSIRIDTRGFTAMCRDLSKMSGTPMHVVIMFEAGKTLETAMRYTKSMSSLAIDRVAARFVARMNTFGYGGVAGQPAATRVYPRINVAPGRDHVWWIDRNDDGKRAFYIMNGGRRWSDFRWAQYQALESERAAAIKEAQSQLPKIRSSRGVSKRSWLQIADDLGITLTGVPGYVRNARPFTGPRVDGIGRKFDTADRFFVELENRNQILIGRQGGAGILQRAVNGRLQHFRTNMRKGVFESVQASVKKYPGVFLYGLS